jgi:MATE family multidrug resistance protein
MRPADYLHDSKSLAALAVPLALTQLAQVALTTTDTVMMSRISAEALAAGGLALVIFNQLRTMGVGLLTAVGNQVAAAAARAEVVPKEAADGQGELRELLRAALALATFAGVVGAILVGLSGEAIGWLGQSQEVVDRSRPVLWALAPGLLPCLWFQAIRQVTVGMRRPQALLKITLASVAGNASLNWVLIHGTFGLPRLGLVGIGLATSLMYLFSGVALYLSARRDPELAPLLSLRIWHAQPSTLRRLTRLGLPIAATYGSESGFFSVIALIIGTFGAAALAAHAAVNQLVYIVFQLAVGLSHAASISVSRTVALGRPQAAVRLARTALACGAIAMTLVAVVYLLEPHRVLRLFFDPNRSSDDAASSIASKLLMIAAALQFFDCAQNIGIGLLRGLDDTAGGFRITLVGYWLIGLPLAWLMGKSTGHDPVGVWSGLLIGLAATATLLLRRFARRSAGSEGPAVSLSGAN